MKQVYSNIPLATGVHIAGICKIQIAAREWLSAEPVIDFNTGKVTTPISFLPTYNWLTIALATDSLKHTEKPKNSKAGSYYDISISGLGNNLDASTLQVLESLRFKEVVVLVTDAKKQKRLVGTNIAGMQLEVGSEQSNGNDGRMEVPISFGMQNNYQSPFYEL